MEVSPDRFKKWSLVQEQNENLQSTRQLTLTQYSLTETTIPSSKVLSKDIQAFLFVCFCTWPLRNRTCFAYSTVTPSLCSKVQAD